MSLTGTSLVVLLAVLAGLIPVAVSVWVAMRRAGDRPLRRVLTGVASFVAIVVCQTLFVGAVFAAVNRSFGFYTSWGDLLGTSKVGVQTEDGGTVTTRPDQGKVVTLTVHGRASLTTMPIEVWLPPQYSQASEKHHKFPVLMMLPGYPGSPAGVVNEFDIISESMAAIDHHQIKPFIGVFPPITIRPGLDTECVNFPGGPLAESWLTKDVRSAVLRHFRASSSGREWAISGWSTGGYCATNLYLHNPKLFHAAFSFGGYFRPAFDKTSNPQLSETEHKLVAANSPIVRFKDDPPKHANLLLIASKDDTESWKGTWYADEAKMAPLARNVPGVVLINLTAGGHHPSTYIPAVPDAMRWLGSLGI